MVEPYTAVFMMLVAAGGLVPLSQSAEKVSHCQDNMWDITHAFNAEEGQADLIMTAPNITANVSSVNSILMCGDLVVNSTGKMTLLPNEEQNATVYHVSVPEAKTVEEFESQGGWQAHSCILQWTYYFATEYEDDLMDQETEEMECEVTLLTVLGRILPRCNLKGATPLLKEVEVDKKLGQVLLTFGNSGNDVFTHDNECEVGSLDEHSHTRALEDNMIPLAPPGADPPIIDIDFYPDCDNETIMKEYRDREMSECHMEIYQVCQEGHQLVKKLELEFDEGALKCEPPKPGYQVLLESLELTFFIESRPVVALLFLLPCNGALYILLIPIVVWKLVRASGCCSRKTITTEEKQSLLDNQQSPPESPAPPHMAPTHTHTTSSPSTPL